MKYATEKCPLSVYQFFSICMDLVIINRVRFSMIDSCFRAKSCDNLVNETKQYFPKGNASSDTNRMTQQRFLSPFSCCAVSFKIDTCQIAHFDFSDSFHFFPRLESMVHRARQTLAFRFELSLDQEIEVQNHFYDRKCSDYESMGGF